MPWVEWQQANSMHGAGRWELQVLPIGTLVASTAVWHCHVTSFSEKDPHSSAQPVILEPKQCKAATKNEEGGKKKEM